MWYNVYMIPIEFKPFLWSYDFDKLSKEENKNIVISAILNYGTYNTWPLLFNLYNKKEIIDILENNHNEWNKKSYNFWHQILN